MQSTYSGYEWVTKLHDGVAASGAPPSGPLLGNLNQNSSRSLQRHSNTTQSSYQVAKERERHKYQRKREMERGGRGEGEGGRERSRTAVHDLTMMDIAARDAAQALIHTSSQKSTDNHTDNVLSALQEETISASNTSQALPSPSLSQQLQRQRSATFSSSMSSSSSSYNERY